MTNDSQERLPQLDAIRGVASLVVVVAHVWSTTSDAFKHAHHELATAFQSVPNALFYLLAKTEETGRSAVILFFVLSGFVLTVSLVAKPTTYPSFVIKRVFRIYPAFVVVILASYLLHVLIGVRHVPESLWAFGAVDSADTSFSILLKTLLFWGTTGTHGLDGVDWTLVHEMRISFLFPLLLILVSRYRTFALAALLALSLACTESLLLRNGNVITGFSEDTLLVTLVDSLYFVVFFAAGAWLALERNAVSETVDRLPASARVLLLAAALVAFAKTDPNSHSAAGCAVDYLRGAGALVVIALALGHNRFSQILRHRGLAALGRLSYSLYLVHLPIIYVFDQLAFDVPKLVSAPTIVLVSLAAAYALSEGVEYPSIALGARLARRVSFRWSPKLSAS